MNRPPQPEGAHRSVESVGTGMWAAIAGVLLFSWEPILIRDNEFEAIPFAFWRLFLAAAWAVAVLRLRGGRLDRRVLRHSWPAGLIFTVNGATFFTAVKTTTIANATIIGATAPIFLLLAANRLFGEKVERHTIIATPVAMAGIGLVIAGGGDLGQGSRMGDLLAVIAMLTFAGYLSASRFARAHLSALEYQAGWSSIAAVLMLPVALLTFDPLVVGDGRSWVIVLVMSVTAGLAHLLINYSHRYVPLRAISVLVISAPVLSVLWAWLLFDERLGGLQWLGVPLVMLAVLAVILRE